MVFPYTFVNCKCHISEMQICRGLTFQLSNQIDLLYSVFKFQSILNRNCISIHLKSGEKYFWICATEVTIKTVKGQNIWKRRLGFG